MRVDGATSGAWRRYLRYYDRSPGSLIAVSLVSVAGTLALVPVPLMIKEALDVAIPQERRSLLLLLGGGLVLAQAINALASIWRRKLVTRHSTRATQRMREDLVRKLYALSFDFHRRSEVGLLHDRVVQETRRIDVMADTLVSSLLPAAVTGIGIGVVLVVMDWQLFLLMLAVVPLIILAHRLLTPQVRRSTQAHREWFAKFSDGIFFILRAMDLTRIKAAEEAETERASSTMAGLQEADWQVAVAKTKYSAVQQSLIAGAGVIILVFGGLAVIGGGLSIGALFAFYAGLAMLRGPMVAVFTSLPYVVAGVQSLEDVDALLAEADARPYSGRATIEFDGEVTLKGVMFDYGKDPVIQSADMVIQPAQTTVLRGLNGSGKSTIANCILGFYRPREGTLYASGHPYEGLDIGALRRRIGVVPQEPVIISGSVAHNISYGHDSATQPEIEHAAQLARAHDFIMQLPHGYETQISHSGLTLSGGQRQRIAIARSLIGQPRLLILDEPTNHLDNVILDDILATLLGLPEAPAVLLISHQRDVEEWADRLYEIEDGFLILKDAVSIAEPPGDGV